jgi:uroporphyrinogen-III synthase
MRRVLVLRPEPGAGATVERARQRGLDAFAVPLFEIGPVDWRPPEAASFDGLLITSANAVRAAGDRLQGLRSLKLYAVGDATALAARDAGFDVAAVGDAGVERLLESIEPDLRLLHLGGEERKEIGDARQEISSITVYRSRPIENPDLSGIGGAVALIHSPRAARRLAELVSDRGSIAITAIGHDAAEAAGHGWQSVETAERPTDDALLALAARLCNKPDPE